MAKYVYQGATYTDAGPKNNEDSYLLIAKKPIFLGVIADGVGGLNKGEVASRFIVKSIEKWFDVLIRDGEEFTVPNLKQEMERFVYKVHEQMLDIEAERNETFGSTLTLAMIIDSDYLICQVGDSRAYLFNGENAMQVTRDQTVEEYEKETGEVIRSVLPEKKSSTLMQCMGYDKITPVFYEGTLPKAYSLLICSDGLSNTLSEDTIAEVLLFSEKSCNEILKELTDKARANEETDNITSVLMRKARKTD